ncbi:ester cyclase [Streptomyces sp. NPDC093085]|uniref:ester cyclase n=1 Tax=Streptomyces sp. NPDC093085 TaxID=3155068 RepID=UPI00342A1C58
MPTEPTAPPEPPAPSAPAVNRFVLPPEPVLRAREKLVLDHFHDEVAQDWDATLATFPHPHYELIAQMTVHDGDSEVRTYYDDTRVAFPDQDHEIIAFRHAVDAVIVEFWLLGTHRGPLGGIPPTGSRHRTRMTAYFIFDEHENLVTERIYFDRLTILKQLVAGVDKRGPRGLLKLARIVRGALGMAGSAPDPRLLRTTPPGFVSAATARTPTPSPTPEELS